MVWYRGNKTDRHEFIIDICYLPSLCSKCNGHPLSIPEHSMSKGMTDEQVLLAYMLHNYDLNTRPVMNASKPVSVKLGITLNQIFDVVGDTDCYTLTYFPVTRLVHFSVPDWFIHAISVSLFVRFSVVIGSFLCIAIGSFLCNVICLFCL